MTERSWTIAYIAIFLSPWPAHWSDAKHVVIAMQHAAKGKSKIVKKCVADVIANTEVELAIAASIPEMAISA